MPEVRVIGATGEPLGILSIAAANKLAVQSINGESYYQVESFPGYSAADMQKTSVSAVSNIESKINSTSIFIRVFVNATGATRPSNQLQPAALSLFPALADTLRAGQEGGALATLVSGSGPTTAFLAKDAESAEAVAEALLASDTCRSVRVAAGPVPGATVV